MSAQFDEAKLRLLLDTGAAARSACGQSFLKLLQPLLDSHVITEERAPGGRRLVVHDFVAARAFLERNFPNTLTDGAALSREIGVARFRNSKAFISDTPEIIPIRAHRDDVILRDGLGVGALQLTADHGVFAFLLRPGVSYSLHGPCALVENPAVFTRIERMNLPIALTIHYHGCVSQRLVAWLALQSSPDFSLLHLPDYDPVGMQEFARLHAILGSLVRLHLPVDLDERFATFSNRKLLQNERSQSLLPRLRASNLPEIRRIVTLIERHNAGLEQEALLL